MEDLLKKQIIEYSNKILGCDFKFREYQFENIYKILNSIINNEKNTIIVNAPTGSGKSIICIICAGVLAEYYNKSSYILCSELMLFDQYYNFIKEHNIDFGMIKGQTGNYKCFVNKKDIIYGECKLDRIPWKILLNTPLALNKGYSCVTKCEYVKARKHALSKKVILMTYHLYINSMQYLSKNPDSKYTFPIKDVIFCDECHNIPDIVQKQYSASISINQLEKLSKLYTSIFGDGYDLFNNHNNEFTQQYTTSNLFYDKLKTYLIDINKETNKESIFKLLDDFLNILIFFGKFVTEYEDDLYLKKINNEFINEEDIKLINWYHSYIETLSGLIEIIRNTGIEYLVTQSEFDEHNKLSNIKFNCVKEDYITYNKLLSHAPYRVLLSATVGGEDISAFVDNIGVKYTKAQTYDYNRIKSTFNFNNSPIYVFNKYKMSYSEKEKSLKYIKELIYGVCKSKYPNKRGIIQTGSYDIAKQIYNDAPIEIKNRMIIYNDSKEKGFSINDYKLTSNSILIGPSLNEGIDFPDDLCRFIIIAKVPYPSLADLFVKEKMKLFPNWYEYTTINQIIQGLGRGIRNKNDYCDTFIFDGCFINLYNKNQNQFPDEIKSRIKFI